MTSFDDEQKRQKTCDYYRANRKTESRDVKKALADSGIPAKVSHGRGTAWGWLKINVGQNPNEHHKITASDRWGPCMPDCAACAWYKDRQRAVPIAQTLTGRRGDYDGRISFLSR